MKKSSDYSFDDTGYIARMESKTLEYKSIYNSALSINESNNGMPSPEEAQKYYAAAKICEEIIAMNQTEPAVQIQWQARWNECTDAVKNIKNALTKINPMPTNNSQGKASTEVKSSAVISADGVATTSTGFTTKNAMKEVPAEVIESWFAKAPGYGLDEVSGMDELKELLLEKVANIGWDEIDKVLGISPTQFFFFYGPPGTGKTYVIDAFANDLMEQGFKYLKLVGGDIHASHVGVAEKTIKVAFKEAIDKAPCIVFIDEIDGVLVRRDSNKAEGHEKRLTNAFLEARNEVTNSGAKVIFMGATNHPGNVDTAMMDSVHLIKVPLPDYEARKEFLIKKLKAFTDTDELSYETMAEKTENCSYRELKRVVEDAVNQLKERAINISKVFTEDGTMDKQKTDSKAAAAIKDGRIKLDSEMFNAAVLAYPPADKSATQAELSEFETGVANPD